MKKALIFILFFVAIGFGQVFSTVTHKQFYFYADSVSNTVDLGRTVITGLYIPSGAGYADTLWFEVSPDTAWYRLLVADSLFYVVSDTTVDRAISLVDTPVEGWTRIRMIMVADITDTLNIQAIVRTKQ